MIVLAALLESACLNGVRSTERSRPSFPVSAADVSDAGPLVKSVARSPGEPWQSTH